MMLGTLLDIDDYLSRLQSELARIPMEDVRFLGKLLYDAYLGGNQVFIIGNGGSACTASHLAEDLGKNSLPPDVLHDSRKRRLKVLSLTDNVGWLTALANDVGYEQIFVQQLMHYGNPGDLLIAISGSGNSSNILTAVDWANRQGMITFGISGFSGGKLKAIQQAGIHVALDDMGMAEGIHLCIGHWLIDDLYARINRVGRYARASNVSTAAVEDRNSAGEECGTLDVELVPSAVNAS
jgi:D-sedoheptulose 7-phosphate isomerase